MNQQNINPGYKNLNRKLSLEVAVKKPASNEGCTRPGGARHDFMRNASSSTKVRQPVKLIPV